MPGYDSSIQRRNYDPELSKRLLQEAGVSNLSFKPVSSAGGEAGILSALLQQQLVKVGIQFQIEQIERATLNERWAQPNNPGVYIPYTTDPDPDRMMSYFVSTEFPPGGLNFAWYSGADELIQQTRTEVNRDKRLQIVKQVQAKFAEDVPGVPLVHLDNVVVLSQNVKGYQYDLFGGHWVNLISLS
jgi:ABC-type transport system substrate-binding protein